MHDSEEIQYQILKFLKQLDGVHFTFDSVTNQFSNINKELYNSSLRGLIQFGAVEITKPSGDYRISESGNVLLEKLMIKHNKNRKNVFSDKMSAFEQLDFVLEAFRSDMLMKGSLTAGQIDKYINIGDDSLRNRIIPIENLNEILNQLYDDGYVHRETSYGDIHEYSLKLKGRIFEGYGKQRKSNQKKLLFESRKSNILLVGSLIGGAFSL